MKKTAIALALLAATGVANAAQVTSLNVTTGDFAMNVAPVLNDGVNDWTGTLAMDTSGTILADAFDFGGLVSLSADGAGLSGNTDSGTLSLDLSNFAIDWAGNHIGQAPTSNFVITDDGAGNFTASWTALIGSGPFAGFFGNWYMAGTYTTSAVPVPAAVWLFGSGLVGLAGIARRRKAA